MMERWWFVTIPGLFLTVLADSPASEHARNRWLEFVETQQPVPQEEG